MGCCFTSDNLVNAIAMGYGAVCHDAVAQSPALVLILSTPNVLLYSNQQCFSVGACCDAHILLTCDIIGDDIYYVVSIGSLFSYHTTIIAP